CGPTSGRTVQVTATGKASGQCGASAGLAAPVLAHVIAITTVPFGPAPGEAAHVVPLGCGIPRLRNQFDRRQHRGMLDVTQQRCVRINAVVTTNECGRQVEPKAVDVHLVHPVPEAVENQPADVWTSGVEGVAASGEV